MGGQDKGLLAWHGAPLARQAALRLAPQVGSLRLNANRHAAEYSAWGWPVHQDDPDLPCAAGPLIGMLTALRHTAAPWVQVVPCDSPQLPEQLVATLLAAAIRDQADIAVPTSRGDADAWRHHWTTILVHRRTLPTLEQAVASGERRVRSWIAMNRWIGVSFERSAEFMNINTPEALHATP
ncbi:MAG: molybdenum cofactor guanylyltransferase [Rubrivivax sp.]|nr:MAG: molybdenum cofactor guanylyltransferase [Rubrivivax sp.]